MRKYQHEEGFRDEMMEMGNFDILIGDMGGLLKNDLITDNLGLGMMKSYDLIPDSGNEDARLFLNVDFIEYNPKLISKMISNVEYENDKIIVYAKGHEKYKSIKLVNHRKLATGECMQMVYLFPKTRVNKCTLRAKSDNDNDPLSTYTLIIECLPDDGIIMVKTKDKYKE